MRLGRMHDRGRSPVFKRIRERAMDPEAPQCCGAMERSIKNGTRSSVAALTNSCPGDANNETSEATGPIHNEMRLSL